MLQRRHCACALLALLLCTPAMPAFAQDAPPHEGEGVSRQARPKAAVPAPGQKAGQKPEQKTHQKAAASAPAGKAATAPTGKHGQAKVARGPAVKNDGKAHLRSLDKNHDGRVSREEYSAGAKKRFAKADANHDGVISAPEAKAAKALLQQKQSARDAKRLAQGQPVKRKKKSDKPAKPYLATFDKNHDGRVTQKEYLARRDKKFAETDLNHDGVISREEARAAKVKLLERREERKAQAQARRLSKAAAYKSQAAAAGASSPGPELVAPVTRPPAPRVATPQDAAPQAPVSPLQDPPLTPLTPSLPAQGVPET